MTNTIALLFQYVRKSNEMFVTFGLLTERNRMGREKQHDRLKTLSGRFMAERHALLGFIYGMIHDLAAAEDILQEVWLRLADTVERDETIRDPSRWCRGVAKNLILHYWRDRQTARVIADSELLALVEQAMNEAPAYEAERRQALQECIDQLPGPSKKLLLLKYERGLSFAAMADHLQRTRDGLKMALCRVRQALLECVERKLQATEYGA